MNIKIIKSGQLTDRDLDGIRSIQKECFSDVSEKEIKEDFYARSFAELIAYRRDNVIGTLHLFKRKIKFDDKNIKLGGVGGVCVTKEERRKGVATKMLKTGMKFLEKEKCDICCLNVDLDKKLYAVYDKVGFVIMEREISFENVYGKIIKDKGTMFAPLLSSEVFEYVMNSDKTFHYGKGYW